MVALVSRPASSRIHPKARQMNRQGRVPSTGEGPWTLADDDNAEISEIIQWIRSPAAANSYRGAPPVAGACPSQLVQLNLPGLSAGVQREELSNDVVGGGLVRHIGGDQGNSPAGRGGTL